MTKTRAIIYLVSLFIITGCYTERISNQNLSFLYNGDSAVLDPEFTIGHTNDSMSYIDFRINSNQLLYLQNANTKYYSAEFRIRYEVIADLASKALLDSTVILYRDSALAKESKFISGRINLKPSTRQVSTVRIDLNDNNRGVLVRKFIELDRRNHNCRQFFTTKKQGSTNAMASNWVDDGNYVITHSNPQYRNATVKYYGRKFPIARPPFSVEPDKKFNLVPDSVFYIVLGETIRFKKEGFYHFQVVDSVMDGLTLFRFRDDFPRVKQVDDLIPPLRILNSKNEFKKIKEAQDRKLAVDMFWLKIAGDKARARSLIRKFYGRVQDANGYFTSHVDGWKTDRGLIYLIYGPPNTLYKNSGNEQWIYGEEGNVSSINFTFTRMKNPFTENDFILDRSPIYKNSWYQAVDSWRQGRIYTDN